MKACSWSIEVIFHGKKHLPSDYLWFELKYHLTSHRSKDQHYQSRAPTGFRWFCLVQQSTQRVKMRCLWWESQHLNWCPPGYRLCWQIILWVFVRTRADWRFAFVFIFWVFVFFVFGFFWLNVKKILVFVLVVCLATWIRRGWWKRWEDSRIGQRRGQALNW